MQKKNRVCLSQKEFAFSIDTEFVNTFDNHTHDIHSDFISIFIFFSKIFSFCSNISIFSQWDLKTHTFRILSCLRRCAQSHKSTLLWILKIYFKSQIRLIFKSMQCQILDGTYIFHNFFGPIIYILQNRSWPHLSLTSIVSMQLQLHFDENDFDEKFNGVFERVTHSQTDLLECILFFKFSLDYSLLFLQELRICK